MSLKQSVETQIVKFLPSVDYFHTQNATVMRDVCARSCSCTVLCNNSTKFELHWSRVQLLIWPFWQRWYTASRSRPSKQVWKRKTHWRSKCTVSKTSLQVWNSMGVMMQSFKDLSASVKLNGGDNAKFQRSLHKCKSQGRLEWKVSNISVKQSPRQSQC